MLDYSVTGARSLPPLVFLHGFLGCKEDWEETIEFLKEEYRCVAFDLPGHGASPLNSDLKASLETLNLENAPIVGYSMGGRVALSLQATAPLILLASHPDLSTQEEREARWQSDLKRAEQLISIPFEDFLEKWYQQPLFASLKKRPDLFEKMLTRRTKQDPYLLAQALKQFSLAKQERTRAFPPSTLYLFGEKDLKFSRLSLTLPASVSIQAIEGCGHAIPYEKPRELARRVQIFLKN